MEVAIDVPQVQQQVSNSERITQTKPPSRAVRQKCGRPCKPIYDLILTSGYGVRNMRLQQGGTVEGETAR